jgi:hypothetical protein
MFLNTYRGNKQEKCKHEKDHMAWVTKLSQVSQLECSCLLTSMQLSAQGAFSQPFEPLIHTTYKLIRSSLPKIECSFLLKCAFALNCSQQLKAQKTRSFNS